MFCPFGEILGSGLIKFINYKIDGKVAPLNRIDEVFARIVNLIGVSGFYCGVTCLEMTAPEERVGVEC